MKPSRALQPTFTVPNYHQRLSASRFVQVYTYDFRENPSDSVACGTVHAWPEVHQLPPHNHEHHELAFIVAGTATHRTAYDVHTVGPGSVLTAAPRDTHTFEHIDGLCMINCSYLTEYLFYDVREIFSVPGLAPLFFRESVFGPSVDMGVPLWTIREDVMTACLYELGDLAAERAREDASPVFIRRTLEKLMLLLCRAFHESGHELRVTSDPDVRALLERIEETVVASSPFDATALAEEMGLSRDRLARRFRSAIGRTPTDYYQHRRVQQACCMLLDSNMSVTEVAHELGYFDTPHFSRLFKRYRGITPKAFRARYMDE